MTSSKSEPAWKVKVRRNIRRYSRAKLHKELSFAQGTPESDTLGYAWLLDLEAEQKRRGLRSTFSPSAAK